MKAIQKEGKALGMKDTAMPDKKKEDKKQDESKAEKLKKMKEEQIKKLMELEEDEQNAESDDKADEEEPDLAAMDEEEFETYRLKKFGQRAINNEDEIKKRLHEVRQNFYNRLESKKLIKKHGKVPFTEHLCVTNPNKI